MSEALTAYAAEMRLYREKAQEMANKLPVKMSAVLASLMLPVIVIINVGPVVIRFMRFFGWDQSSGRLVIVQWQIPAHANPEGLNTIAG